MGETSATLDLGEALGCFMDGHKYTVIIDGSMKIYPWKAGPHPDGYKCIGSYPQRILFSIPENIWTPAYYFRAPPDYLVTLSEESFVSYMRIAAFYWGDLLMKKIGHNRELVIDIRRIQVPFADSLVHAVPLALAAWMKYELDLCPSINQSPSFYIPLSP